MKRLEFDCPFHLTDTMLAMLGEINDDYPVISVYGKYEVIKDILEDLIMSGVCIDGSIELEDFDVSGYDKEFVINLTTDGISVCKSWCEEKECYYDEECNIAFVHEDCNSKLLSHIESTFLYEFAFDEYCDCCDECSECDEDECCHCGEVKDHEVSDKCVTYAKDDNGDTHGFIASRSDGNSCYGVSFYSTDKLSMRDIQSLMQECGF